MKREQRRVRLARRQALLARVGERAAMRGLADALAQETRSDALAQRSRALLASYGEHADARDGAALAHAVGFAGALAVLTHDAEAARTDAERQAQWQAQALGEAQTRARRCAERLEEALTVGRFARERRERDPALAATPAGSKPGPARAAGLGTARAETRSRRPADKD